MKHSLSDNEVSLAKMIYYQRNMIIALAAIVASFPKDMLQRDIVRENILKCPLFDGLAGKDDEVKAAVEKLADQILGPE